MFDLLDIEKRNKAGKRVTQEEYLYLLKNNASALWAFLISNNAGNINHTLRNLLGYVELSFYPNIQAIATQIGMMRDKKEVKELDTVLANFVLKTEGYNPDFIEKFKTILNK